MPGTRGLLRRAMMVGMLVMVVLDGMLKCLEMLLRSGKDTDAVGKDVDVGRTRRLGVLLLDMGMLDMTDGMFRRLVVFIRSGKDVDAGGMDVKVGRTCRMMLLLCPVLQDGTARLCGLWIVKGLVVRRSSAGVGSNLNGMTRHRLGEDMDVCLLLPPGGKLTGMTFVADGLLLARDLLGMLRE
eukprot:s496_g3.t1